MANPGLQTISGHGEREQRDTVIKMAVFHFIKNGQMLMTSGKLPIRPSQLTKAQLITLQSC